ncbi:MAG: RNA polymerase sigma factor [Oscillospiraceae bacterium]|nr:RNA polymerase sigma factor [Oscillospiraceae bacterium]MCL2279474.1 RNA polymerase sigma factor [Oscillospiraceae bacterium]
MEELRRELVSYIRRKFNNLNNIADLAEDIVHDAFLLVKNEAQYNFGYLGAISVRLAYREYKKQKRQETDYIDLLVSEDDVVQQVMERESANEVLASLDTLREIERKILVLRYYEDCSFAEISRKTGVNLNTVLTTHYRALEKLRPRLSKLTKYGNHPEETPYLKGENES